ncbi:MAG TPA: hypothetical protein VF503_15010 [Sphingobium sp.]|uniref:hypothetical protein n=1 Tax=Sphingobium sp. TaxID=1912891 RepID=UPI002ED5B2F7
MTSLDEELEHRSRAGQHPLRLRDMKKALLAIGYSLDRSQDCRGTARWMTGDRAGKSYPCITTGTREADTGLSAFNCAVRRDQNFARLQEMRTSGNFFAISKGGILEP